MSDSYSKWSDVKARGRAADPRGPTASRLSARRQPASAGKHTFAGTSWQKCAPLPG